MQVSTNHLPIYMSQISLQVSTNDLPIYKSDISLQVSTDHLPIYKSQISLQVSTNHLPIYESHRCMENSQMNANATNFLACPRIDIISECNNYIETKNQTHKPYFLNYGRCVENYGGFSANPKKPINETVLLFTRIESLWLNFTFYHVRTKSSATFYKHKKN